MRARLRSFWARLLTVALAVSAFLFYSRWQAARTENTSAKEALANARAQIKEAEERIPSRQFPEPDAEGLRQDHTELARLRNEVTQLREQDRDFRQIARQAEYWQQKARELVAENNRLKSGSTNLENSDADTQRLACLKNLNEIAAAKQKWAEATQVERGSLADLNEIVPYLPNGRLPFCPSGGNYQINRVGAPPVCSYAGHVLKDN